MVGVAILMGLSVWNDRMVRVVWRMMDLLNMGCGCVHDTPRIARGSKKDGCKVGGSQDLT